MPMAVRDRTACQSRSMHLHGTDALDIERVRWPPFLAPLHIRHEQGLMSL